MLKKLFYLLLGIGTVILLMVDVLPKTDVESYDLIEGEITSVSENSLTVMVLTGAKAGEEIEVPVESTIFESDYEVGEKLVIQDWERELAGSEYLYNIEGYVRRPVVWGIFILFVLTVLLVTGWQGVRSLLGLVFSFIILFRLIFPLMILGFDPLWTAILGSVLIVPCMFYLTHGLNRKTTAAIVGTFFALVVSGLLAALFAQLGHLTGLTDEGAIFLKTQLGSDMDFQKLLLAGILISMLGVLDDVSIAQASVVHELKASKKNMKFWELYSRGMRVGKDHIGSVVNTLVLVFAGASLPMLIVFIVDNYGAGSVVNYEFVATEIIQTFAASIGLILTVPLTTFFASVSVQK